MIFTTKVKTQDGRVFDLGRGQHPPKHSHLMACPECLVVNAWTEQDRVEVEGVGEEQRG